MDESAPSLHAGSIISGRYRLERVIARGGMGRVFLATQLALQRQVALKVLLPQPRDKAFRRRFLLEASVCARLVHRNIVTVHDYGETDDGQVYMAMEYLDGLPLSTLIAREVRLSGDRACRIAIQICRALNAAHAIGVVHRDLKPGNIMLVRDEEAEGVANGEVVKVLDFGLVKVFEHDQHNIRTNVDLTGAGTLLGSPKYMAPEQIRSGAVDGRTDIYSLGVILFHMLAGRAPFLAPTGLEILHQHLREAPPRLSEVLEGAGPVAPQLEAIVQKAMSKNPAHRQQSMEELLVELKDARRVLSGEHHPTPTPGALSLSSRPKLEPADVEAPDSIGQAQPFPDTVRVRAAKSRRISPMLIIGVVPVLAALLIVPWLFARPPTPEESVAAKVPLPVKVPPPAKDLVLVAPVSIDLPLDSSPPAEAEEAPVVEERAKERVRKKAARPPKRARVAAHAVEKVIDGDLEKKEKEALPSLDEVDRDRAKDVWAVDQVPIVD